jgi:hypothetical protein
MTEEEEEEEGDRGDGGSDPLFGSRSHRRDDRAWDGLGYDSLLKGSESTPHSDERRQGRLLSLLPGINFCLFRRERVGKGLWKRGTS